VHLVAARNRGALEAVAGELANDPVVLETDLAGAGPAAARFVTGETLCADGGMARTLDLYGGPV
jgi:hypothetical protein